MVATNQRAVSSSDISMSVLYNVKKIAKTNTAFSKPIAKKPPIS